MNPPAQPHPRRQAGRPAPQRDQIAGWIVAAGLLVAPAAWFIQLNASYLLGASHCPGAPAGLSPSVSYALIVAGGLSAACLAALALWAARRTWSLTREEGPGEAAVALNSGHGRTRFLGLAGMIVSGIFLIAIGFSLIIPLLERTCAV